MEVTGTQVNYYFVCKRKLWFFSNQIQMEGKSDLVSIGKLIHKKSFKRKGEEIKLGKIKIDFLEEKNEVHEVKKSDKVKKAHIFQVLYYLYYLKKKGINAKGVIHYPKLKKKERVTLTKEKEEKIEKVIKDIQEIMLKDSPPEATKKPYCDKCSYYQFCWC